MRAYRFLALALGLAAMPALAADRWQLQHPDSRLGFEATQQGGQFEGHFADYSAQMRFSADDLANSGFDVRIAMTSVDTGSGQRDNALPDKPWFHTEVFPEARYVTREIRRTDDGYEAVGDLTIRDNTHEVILPFTWQVDGDTAMMDGSVVIDRTRFGVGQGEWQDPQVAGHDVEVIVDLTLDRVAD